MSPRALPGLAAGLGLVVLLWGCAGSEPSGFVSWLPDHTIVLAQRGAAGLAPENTVPAVQAAQQPGVEAEVIELDLVLSADREIVLLHDATVDRTTGIGLGCESASGSGAVPAGSLSADQLAALDAGACFVLPGFGSPFAGLGHGIPRLEDVLDLFPGQRFVLDIEHPDAELPPVLVELLEDTESTDRVCVRALDSEVAEILSSVAPPNLCQAHSSSGLRCWASQGEGPFAATSCPRADLAWAEGLDIPALDLPRTRADLEAAGVPLFVDEAWLPDPDSSDVAAGIRGIATDRPDLARAALGAPGIPLEDE